MIRRPPRSTRTDTLFPYTTLFRSNLSPIKDVKGSPFTFWLTDYIQKNLHLIDQNTSGNLALCDPGRPEEHTSELQSLMRISYAVFCLKKKKQHNNNPQEKR